MKQFGLGKKERLKSRKGIEALFAGGQGFTLFPLRVTFRLLPAENSSGAQVGVTASRRQFKKAVDRNRIKRLLREAYRLNKKDFIETLTSQGLQAQVFFSFIDKTLPSFPAIEGAMKAALKRLNQKAGSDEKTA
jgi:ribonuclease P protein component